MEWMNISYILAFLAVFVASASQILLKQSAETEHKNIITKFLNWRVILGYGRCRNDSSECICLSGNRAEGNTMIEATGIIWVTLLAASILGERPTKRTILSIVITVIGIIVFSL